MAQQQQQGSGGDNSLAPVWIMALLVITAYVIWYSAHQYIVSFVFSINLFQAKIIQFFVDPLLLQTEIHYMQTIDPAAVTWNDLTEITQSIGEYTRYPVVVLFATLAVFIYLSNIKLKYRHAHNMATLRQQEQQNWSSIKPVVKLDLAKEDINIGPWAMALTPMEFARKNHLLKKEDALLDPQSPGMEGTAGIRRQDAKRIFTMQLGPYFDGFDKSPPYAQALAAVFMARINRDRDAASKILSALDETVTEGKANYSIAYPTLQKYHNTELVQQAISGHAYLLTVMASLLAAARDDGVVASAEFLWLKAIDRRLWYMLNSVGRQTPYAEISGPFAHWKAEIALGRRSLVPMIDEAIKALEVAIKEVKLSSKELQELEA